MSLPGSRIYSCLVCVCGGGGGGREGHNPVMQQSSDTDTDISSKEKPHATLLITRNGHKFIMECTTLNPTL